MERTDPRFLSRCHRPTEHFQTCPSHQGNMFDTKAWLYTDRHVFIQSTLQQRIRPTSFSSSLTHNVESSCKCFHTGEFAWPAIVHWICSHQKGQQAEMASLHLGKWRLIQLCPRAVNHRNSILSHNLSKNTATTISNQDVAGFSLH